MNYSDASEALLKLDVTGHTVGWILKLPLVLLSFLSLLGLIVLRIRRNKILESRWIAPWCLTFYVLVRNGAEMVYQFVLFIIKRYHLVDAYMRDMDHMYTCDIIVYAVAYPALFVAAHSLVLSMLRNAVLRTALETAKASFYRATQQQQDESSSKKSSFLAEAKTIRILKILSSVWLHLIYVAIVVALFEASVIVVIVLDMRGIITQMRGFQILDMLQFFVLFVAFLNLAIALAVDLVLMLRLLVLRQNQGTTRTKLLFLLDAPYFARLDYLAALLIAPVTLAIAIGNACQCYNMIVMTVLMVFQGLLLLLPGGLIVLGLSLAQCCVRRVRLNQNRLASKNDSKGEHHIELETDASTLSPEVTSTNSVAASSSVSTDSIQHLLRANENFGEYFRLLIQGKGPIFEDFKRFCQSEFSCENLYCAMDLLAIEKSLKANAFGEQEQGIDEQTKGMWTKFIDTYLRKNATLEVNLPNKVRLAAIESKLLNYAEVSAAMEAVRREVYANSFDTFTRFTTM